MGSLTHDKIRNADRLVERARQDARNLTPSSETAIAQAEATHAEMRVAIDKLSELIEKLEAKRSEAAVTRHPKESA